MPPPSLYPPSLGSSSSAPADASVLVSVSRLTHQLNLSREDLAHERQSRDLDRQFYEQEIAVLKEENQWFRSVMGKGKGRE
jgi:hypothetical protein